jgi:hypothetical protein
MLTDLLEHTDATGCVSLRVHIDQQYFAASGSQICSQVDSGGGFVG